MIERTLAASAVEAARFYPVVTVTGPRQSGKTTLAKACFPDKAYVSLENRDNREWAVRDPRDFLARFSGGAIIDEVQKAPDLLSYLQTEVDLRPGPCRFVLTASQDLLLLKSVSQSLAGRTAVLHLYPADLAELRRFEHHPSDLFSTLWSGGYPAIHDRGIPAGRWMEDYVATFIERDVREVVNVGDLFAFQAFVRLCAGRTGQLLNLSSIAADCGVSHGTARAWLSVLQATFVVMLLPPWHTNLNKRLVRAPKLHFIDSGLACHLLRVRSPEDLADHPARGAIFESWVVSEVMKARAHRGAAASDLHFFRDRKGLEVDLLVDLGRSLVAVETKSGRTVAGDFTDALDRFAKRYAAEPGRREIRRLLVHGGDDSYEGGGTRFVGWAGVDGLLAQ